MAWPPVPRRTCGVSRRSGQRARLRRLDLTPSCDRNYSRGSGATPWAAAPPVASILPPLAMVLCRLIPNDFVLSLLTALLCHLPHHYHFSLKVRLVSLRCQHRVHSVLSAKPSSTHAQTFVNKVLPWKIKWPVRREFGSQPNSSAFDSLKFLNFSFRSNKLLYKFRSFERCGTFNWHYMLHFNHFHSTRGVTFHTTVLGFNSPRQVMWL